MLSQDVQFTLKNFDVEMLLIVVLYRGRAEMHFYNDALLTNDE